MPIANVLGKMGETSVCVYVKIRKPQCENEVESPWVGGPDLQRSSIVQVSFANSPFLWQK